MLLAVGVDALPPLPELSTPGPLGVFDAVQQLLAPWSPEQLAVYVDAEALHAELFGPFHSWQ